MKNIFVQDYQKNDKPHPNLCTLFYWLFYTKINHLFCAIFLKIILAIFSGLWYYNTCKEERDKKANKKTYKKVKKVLDKPLHW